MTIRDKKTLNATRLTAILGLCLGLLLLTGCRTALDIRNEGITALNKGQNELAVQKFTEAVERDPSSARSRYQLGRGYLAINEDVKAQYELQKALALRPNDPELTPDILDSLAEAIYRQDLTANLYAFLEKQVKDFGTTRDYLRQGTYMAKAGDPDAARLAFRKGAYFAAPNDPEPYIAIADFYTAIGDQPEAITALRYANYVDPGNQEVAERLRQFGIVPGPTVTEAPPKPDLLN